MGNEVLGWIAILHAALGVVGYIFVCLDYEQKVDEGREIDERVWRARQK